jgi:hypothetical protein
MGYDLRIINILGLLLVLISVAFMVVSVYLMADNRILASLLSLAIGLITLSGGLNILRTYRGCRD